MEFYYDKGTFVSNDLSLEVKPGELIALVGPTGGGKTTLVNLICRFYEPRSGTISSDGENELCSCPQAFDDQGG